MPRQPLELRLAALRRGAMVMGFTPQQRHGPPTTRVAGTAGEFAVVLAQPSLDVAGNARVQAAVAAAQHVDVPDGSRRFR